MSANAAESETLKMLNFHSFAFACVESWIWIYKISLILTTSYISDGFSDGMVKRKGECS